MKIHNYYKPKVKSLEQKIDKKNKKLFKKSITIERLKQQLKKKDKLIKKCIKYSHKEKDEGFNDINNIYKIEHLCDVYAECQSVNTITAIPNLTLDIHKIYPHNRVMLHPKNYGTLKLLGGLCPVFFIYNVCLWYI